MFAKSKQYITNMFRSKEPGYILKPATDRYPYILRDTTDNSSTAFDDGLEMGMAFLDIDVQESETDLQQQQQQPKPVPPSLQESQGGSHSDLGLVNTIQIGDSDEVSSWDPNDYPLMPTPPQNSSSSSSSSSSSQIPITTPVSVEPKVQDQQKNQQKQEENVRDSDQLANILSDSVNFLHDLPVSMLCPPHLEISDCAEEFFSSGLYNREVCHLLHHHHRLHLLDLTS